MPFPTASESIKDVWARGAKLLDDGDLPRASDCFEHVLEYNPRAADAWLGLHACGEQQETALLRMVECADEVGKLRRATGLGLKSTFSIGNFVEFPLSEAIDAWFGYVAALIVGDRVDHAKEVLATATREDDMVRFLRARCSFQLSDWEQVLADSHDIEHPLLNDEAQLYAATALMHLGTHYEALDILTALPAENGIDDPGYDAQVSYVGGRSLEALGQAKEAARMYQRAFRLSPEVELFAKAAGAARPAGSSRASVEEGFSQLSADGEDGDRAAMLQDAARRLDAMIGLDPVKDQIKTLQAQFKMALLRKERGLPDSSRPHHFVFTGPPGTGKTTVARIMGEILAGLGLLEHGRVVETQRGDLVGQYLGATALKTRKRIEEATGGVLFIDEAYALETQGYSGKGDAFGKEAMQEILTAAENRRDTLVIVLAGYTKEMEDLLATNPGLRSRFSTVVDFPTYSAQELFDIAVSILAAGGERLSVEAEVALSERFDAVVGDGSINTLGNARLARELCRKAMARRDLRLVAAIDVTGTPSVEEMTTVEADDVARAFQELTDGVREPRPDQVGPDEQ
ncbi:AAA family ATPase [Glycomyces buryatensis]|uniref:AAA family ATPase n=1 Tax=Glycomyces buryatensis TaxID=2570927 RepID=A0A4S8PRQ1_9ACTN|nr:AAA family ATPase [Glycomyces buryatensis]THV33908.1 AAA family ATPase [Glycomyces buryatensis]